MTSRTIRSRTWSRPALVVCALVGGFAGGFGGVADAQFRADEVPRQLEGVGVVQKIGEQVPLDLAFFDAEGKAVRLGDYFQAGRPVLLSLNYSNCPQLCILQLDELAARLGKLDWTAGDQFQVLTVSIDPDETPAQAMRKQDLYAQRYNRAGSEGGWNFLVGKQPEITALTEAVGFGYRFDPESGEFAHDAALMVLSPTGVVSRYVFGVLYDDVALRFSLIDASEGKLGTISDSFMMLCFQYDPNSGSYVMAAKRVMAIGGAITVLMLGGLLFFLSRFRPGGGPPQDDSTAARSAAQRATPAQAT